MRAGRGAGPGRRRILSATALAVAIALAGLAGSRSSLGQAESFLTVERPLVGWRERLTVTSYANQRYLRARDLARVTESSFAWRSDIRKCVLRNRRHALKFTVGTRYVVVDENRVLQIDAPVRQEAGEVYVPLSALIGPLAGSLVREAHLHGARLTLEVEEPNAGRPELEESGAETRLLLPVPPHSGAGLLSPRASRFAVRVPYLRLPPLAGDSLAPLGLVERLRFRRQPSHLGIEFRLSPRATAYRIRQAPGDSLLESAFLAGPRRPEFVALAPEEPAFWARPLRVLVLDPGHGGADSGVVAGPGVREKDLTLALARRVRLELARLLPEVRVVLTRDDDRGLALNERVQMANRERADLLVSLHLDGLPRGRMSGVTAYVAPPLTADRSLLLDGEEEARGRTGRRLWLVRWQRAAGRHHAEARAAAERLLEGLALDGFGPARLRIARSYPTQGADCPSVLLECGTLTAAGDRGRLATEEGLERVARAVARALRAHAVGES